MRPGEAPTWSETDIVERLRGLRRAAGNGAALARELGLTASYVNEILRDGRGVGPKLLKALGLRPVVRFEAGPWQASSRLRRYP